MHLFLLNVDTVYAPFLTVATVFYKTFKRIKRSQNEEEVKLIRDDEENDACHSNVYQ